MANGKFRDMRSVFCKNHIFGILAIIVARFGFFIVFQAFLYMFWDINLKLGTYISSRECHTSSSSFIPIGTLWPTLEAKISQSNFSAFMASKIIWRPQIWYTHLYSECLEPYWFSSCLGPLADKNTRKWELVELPASEKFSGLFLCMFWDISLKLGIYI